MKENTSSRILLPSSILSQDGCYKIAADCPLIEINSPSRTERDSPLNFFPNSFPNNVGSAGLLMLLNINE